MEREATPIISISGATSAVLLVGLLLIFPESRKLVILACSNPRYFEFWVAIGAIAIITGPIISQIYFSFFEYRNVDYSGQIFKKLNAKGIDTKHYTWEVVVDAFCHDIIWRNKHSADRVVTYWRRRAASYFVFDQIAIIIFFFIGLTIILLYLPPLTPALEADRIPLKIYFAVLVVFLLIVKRKSKKIKEEYMESQRLYMEKYKSKIIKAIENKKLPRDPENGIQRKKGRK